MPDALIPTVAADAIVEAAGSSSAFERAAAQVIAARRSKHTRRAYAADLKSWLAACSTAGTDPAVATLRDSTAFRDRLQAIKAAGSVRRTLSALSLIYSTLREGGITRGNPFSPKVLGWPADQAVPTPLVDDKDALAMLASCGTDKFGLRDAAVLALLYWTGLRRSSVAFIELSQVTEINGRMVIRTVVKGGRMTEKIIPPEAAARVRLHLKTLGPGVRWLFPGELGQPLNPGSVNEIVDRRAKLAGCYGRVSPHSFRAAFITAAYDAGLAERAIADAVDHRWVETTRRYDRKQRGDAAIDGVAKARATSSLDTKE